MIGNGGFIDSSNNDISMNRIHSGLGEKMGLTKAGSPIEILKTFNMLENTEEGDK